MFFLRRWIQKYLYKLVKQEEELQEQATGWHRAIAVVPCLICAKPVMPDSVFCRYCGAATQQQTTGAQKLVRVPDITIPAMVLPGTPGMVLPERKIPGAMLPVQNIPTIALPKPPLRAHVLTNQIEAAQIPNEDYGRMRAYNRLKRQGKV